MNYPLFVWKRVFVCLCPCSTGFMILPSVLIARAEVMWALGCLVKTVLLHNWAWSHNLAQGLPSHSHLMHAGYSHVKRRVGNGARRLLSVCLLCQCMTCRDWRGGRGRCGVGLLAFVFCPWSVNDLQCYLFGRSHCQCLKNAVHQCCLMKNVTCVLPHVQTLFRQLLYFLGKKWSIFLFQI